MIVLDTHVWIWWIDGGAQLPADYRTLIQANVSKGLGVCAISCWEVAKLVELGRLQLAIGVEQWLIHALLPPIQLLPLTPESGGWLSGTPGQISPGSSGLTNRRHC